MFPVFNTQTDIQGESIAELCGMRFHGRSFPGQCFRYILSSHRLPAAIRYEGMARLNFSHKVGN